MKKIVYALLALSLFAVFGCGSDTNNNSSSVTNPNASIFTPMGTVSGVLTDTVTTRPIINAAVYIMDRYAITGDQGQFTIYNVPANTPVGTETGTSATDPYNVVIDLKNVNSAIDAHNADPANAADQWAKYPAIAYTSVSVKYTSLGETSGASGLGTNHDTPTNGFVANIQPQVGKLDGFLKVQVVKASDLTVVAGAKVELLSQGAGSLANAPTGTNTITPGHLVATTTTDASGIASFGPVEAGTTFVARATSSDTRFQGVKTVITEGDNISVSYLVQGINTPLAISSVDTIAPFVVATTPANLADLAIPATGNLDIVFSFSEPIKATNYANAVSAELAINGGLYNDVTVNTNGPKIGNISHSLAWSADRTTLTVSIPATSLVAAYKYTVALTGVAAGKLSDNSNNLLTAGSTVNFTTSGGINVSAPVTTQSSTSSSVISWTQVNNAVSYNVYVDKIVNGAKMATQTVNNGGALSFNLAAQTIFTVTTPVKFDTGNVTYSVTVKAVNTSGSESAASTAIVVSDTLLAAPTVALPDLTLGAPFNFTWIPVTNATGYQYAVETITAGVGGGYAAPATVAVSQATVAVGSFVSGEQKVSYNVKFRSVNANGTPGAWSTPLTIEDKVGPSITARSFAGVGFMASGSSLLSALDPSTTTGLNGNNKTKDYTFTVSFSEQMNKVDVQTAANWSVSKGTATNGGLFVAGAADVTPTIKGVTYDPSTFTATVTITYTNDATNTATTDPSHTVFIFAGKDLNGNTIKTSADAVDSAAGIF